MRKWYSPTLVANDRGLIVETFCFKSHALGPTVNQIPLNKPLTNLQLELWQLYSLNLSENDLLELRRIIARYFATSALSSFN